MKDAEIEKEVEEMIQSFLGHIAGHWNDYKDYLPHLCRTMSVYEDFWYFFRNIPENVECRLEFNPKLPLTVDLPTLLPDKHARDLVYGAWMACSDKFWFQKFKEPTNETVEIRGIPSSLFAGYTTIEEFSWQTKFLDSIRNHPKFLEGKAAVQTQVQIYKDEQEKKLKELDATIANLKADEKKLLPVLGENFNVLMIDLEDARKFVLAYMP